MNDLYGGSTADTLSTAERLADSMPEMCEAWTHFTCGEFQLFLDLAVATGRFDAVASLIESHAEGDTSEGDIHHDVFLAQMSGDMDEAQRLIRQHVKNIDL